MTVTFGEYGIFGEDGCVEASFSNRAAAEAAIVDRYSLDDELRVEIVCPDHPETIGYSCEECLEDDS